MATGTQQPPRATKDAWEDHLLNPGAPAGVKYRHPGGAPAWATNRLDLIESLDYYRQAQSGIVITKLEGGGTACKDPNLARTSTRLPAALRSMINGSPVGLILGSSIANANSPIKIDIETPCRYVVLGEYIVTDIWYEKQDNRRNTVLMIGYQRRDLDEAPWWQKRMRPPRLAKRKIRSNGPMQLYTCKTCGEDAPHRYDVWVCTNPACADLSNGSYGNLHAGSPFHDDYLLHKTPPLANVPHLILDPFRLIVPTPI
ncbi:hypothetical protein B0H63DRAFT_550740 [Podospora didyma]|uniref:YDG domain-containing protein n=1 Tax=Podospora didyma TaxID=330526 RepID=A0AAE0N7F8_9PEZI|nr:hypothetical protein B0H63DRAFT_550740 [Podospora didyma]